MHPTTGKYSCCVRKKKISNETPGHISIRIEKKKCHNFSSELKLHLKQHFANAFVCVCVCDGRNLSSNMATHTDSLHRHIHTWRLKNSLTGDGGGGRRGMFYSICQKRGHQCKSVMSSILLLVNIFFFFFSELLIHHNRILQTVTIHYIQVPCWRTADTKIEVLLIKSRGIKASCFWIWRRLDYSFACFAYSQLGIV